ncbi:uncharacterized protein [Montipora capricornis]|uniref:uncharacterized protein n=1 Tax=Montipora capricornis TaxID=246305 RepID=UPI0035F1D2CD
MQFRYLVGAFLSLESFILLVYISSNVNKLAIPGLQPNIKLGNIPNKNTENVSARTFRKPFIYLTQTEKCIPLRLLESIGINDTCNCDVLVLSYQAECTELSSVNVAYLFERSSTWSSGRNALYFAAVNRTSGYHYYIFLDDDVNVIFNKFTPPDLKKKLPLQSFQQWLLHYEPVVGVLDYLFHHGAVWTFERRKALCGIRNDTSLSLPVVWFDAAFNAFHYKAIADILPYDTQYDDTSWWLSQVVVITLVELKFRGQALLYVPATAKNPKHRPYPRYGRISVNEVMRTLIEQAERDAPTVEEHTVKSSTYCMKVTPHLPPYAHFNTTSA